MTASLPSKLAIGLIFLSAILIATLYTVHKTPSFQIDLPAWTMDTPSGMGMDGSTKPNNRNHNRREMRETVVKEEDDDEKDEEMEDRGPMNIILFYADDWRHDVRIYNPSVFFLVQLLTIFLCCHINDFIRRWGQLEIQ